MKNIFIVLIFIFLTNCFGPTIATVGPYNITYTDIITSPSKVNKVYDYFKYENKIISDTF